MWKNKLHPMMSRMHEEVLIDLQSKGHHPMVDKPFCVEQTLPDLYFEKERLAVYLDGEQVHEKRVEKDELLRGKLAKFYKVKVMSMTYERYSEKGKREIVKRIVDELESKTK